MNRFQFQTVPNIIAGLGTIQELFKILKNGRYQRLLLVTDPGMLKQQLHLPILDIIEVCRAGVRDLLGCSSRSTRYSGA